MQLPTDEKYTHSKTFLEHTICILFGGRIAEKIVFDEITTGAGNDLERSSALARKMVCEWGMSDELGPLTYGKKEEQPFLGKEIGQSRDFSESTAREIDTAVRRIIDNASEKVTQLLTDHRDALNKISEELLERETIMLDDIEDIMEELYPGKYPSKKPKVEIVQQQPEAEAAPEEETKKEDVIITPYEETEKAEADDGTETEVVEEVEPAKEVEESVTAEAAEPDNPFAKRAQEKREEASRE